MRPYRLHWPAIVVAMIASFLFEAGWYSYFMTPWLIGVGRTSEWMHEYSGMMPPVQYAIAMLCSLIAAAVLSLAIQVSGEQTLLRGIKVGAVLWLGFIATSWATEYAFEVRSLEIFAINTGAWLANLVIMGAIVGAWRGQPAPLAP